jgi:hypothetical protein
MDEFFFRPDDDPAVISMMQSQAYVKEDIEEAGGGSLIMNGIPLRINFINARSYSGGFLAGSRLDDAELDKMAARENVQGKDFYRLFSKIAISWRRGAVPEEDFLVSGLGLDGRIFPEGGRGGAYGAICIYNGVPAAGRPGKRQKVTEDNITVSYYMPDVMVKINNVDNAFFRNKLSVKAYVLHDMLPPAAYCQLASHISDKYIYSNAKDGHAGLMKDLLMRLMTIFDVPLVTECGAGNNCNIQPLKLRPVTPKGKGFIAIPF